MKYFDIYFKGENSVSKIYLSIRINKQKKVINSRTKVKQFKMNFPLL